MNNINQRVSEMVKVAVPAIDEQVTRHHELAEAAIAAMSPSRRYGADTALRSWRRVLQSFNPAGLDGYAFSGHQVQPGSELSLPIGALIIGLDDSYAVAKWYSGRYVAPRALRAFLQRVGPDGLEALFETDRAPWAPKVLGFLATTSEICSAAGVTAKSSPRPVRPQTHNRR